jgi:putative transposase
MHWLTTTHAIRWHRDRGSTGSGAVYQSRYVSVGIEDGRHYFTALRYVERNALAAGIVTVAEHWPWGSASTRTDRGPKPELCAGPYMRPTNWQDILNGD